MMIGTMETVDYYAAPLMRAFRQAPWRTQTQAMAAWSVVLLSVLVVGGLYLAVAARAATAGRDLQALEARKAALIQANDELRAEVARLRSVQRLAERALALGFRPVNADQMEYLPVEHYPHEIHTTPLPRAQVPPPEPDTTWGQLADVMGHALQGLVTFAGRWDQIVVQPGGK